MVTGDPKFAFEAYLLLRAVVAHDVVFDLADVLGGSPKGSTEVSRVAFKETPMFNSCAGSMDRLNSWSSMNSP